MDNNDLIREFLITKFICADCGNNLQLSYENKKATTNYSEGEPTGAAMVMTVVSVHPCAKCRGKYDKFKQCIEAIITPENCKNHEGCKPPNGIINYQEK
jgi:hypothetical protein